MYKVPQGSILKLLLFNIGTYYPYAKNLLHHLITIVSYQKECSVNYDIYCLNSILDIINIYFTFLMNMNTKIYSKQ